MRDVVGGQWEDFYAVGSRGPVTQKIAERRTRLNRERVLEAAVSLADAVGIGMVEVTIMDADGNPVLVDQHV